MDINAVVPPGVSQVGAGGSGGWGWNPLTDFQKAVSGVGDFVDSHTQIGSFNPGIGHLVAMGANMLPGLTNAGFHIGSDVLHGDLGKAQGEAGQMAQGMWHGLTDTATDVVTLGGLAPWTKGVENAQQSVYGYKPSTLKQYATSPGEGLGGALFNDAANVAMAADGAGALAKLGEVGKAAEAARGAELASKVGAIDAAAEATDVGKAGDLAREETLTKQAQDISDAGGDGEAFRQRVEQRMKTMDHIDATRQGASYLLEPWKALRPLARAAGELHGATAETPIPSETPSEAPGAPQEPAGSTVPPEAQQAASASPEGSTPLKAAMEAAVAAHEGVKTAVPEEPPPAADMRRIYNAGSTSNQEMWTTNKARAESYSEGGPVRYMDMGTDSVKKLQDAEAMQHAREAGHQPTKGDVFLADHPRWQELTQEPKEYHPGAPAEAAAPGRLTEPEIDRVAKNMGLDRAVVERANQMTAKEADDAFRALRDGPLNVPDMALRRDLDPIRQEAALYGQLSLRFSEAERVRGSANAVSPEVAAVEAAPAGTEPSPPATAEAKAHGIAKVLENVPRAYTSYLEQAKPVPQWAKTLIEHMPVPAQRLLAWMDAHHQKVDYQVMTRQQQRALAIEAKRIEKLPEVDALKAQATDIVSQHLEGVTPTVASNIVGQLVRAYITHGPELIEHLESSRGAMEEARPGEGSLLVDSQLGYSFHIPDVLNTPDFRAQIFALAEPVKQLRLEASARMRQSEFLADKGLEDHEMPLLTKGEKKILKVAQSKLNQALNLEQKQVPKELAGAAKEKAQTEDIVAKAVSTSQAALETMVEARTDFDRSRYVPESIDTPEKLAGAMDDLASRTIRQNGGTYNPTTGSFITAADGSIQGYLIGALPDPVATISLADFMDTNPETGRLRGAEMLDNMVHGYQEAFQFPNMTVGTWVDDDGNVHIDPAQFIEGQSARDHAMTLGAAREQKSIYEVHTGSEIPLHNDPNVSAYFVKTHQARDLRGRQLRAIIDKQIAAGGHGMSEDDIDRFMAFTDRMAVTEHLLHPDQYKSADQFYTKGFSVTFAERRVKDALTEARGENVLGQFVPSTSVTGGVIRLFKDADLGTLFHEGGHLLRALTTADDLKELERTYGVVRGKWTPEAEEAFVHDFLATASQATEGPMSNLKDVLAQAYGDFGEPLHPEIDSFWQKALAGNVERVTAPGYELSTGEKIVGVDARTELGKTMAQRQRMTPTPEGTKLQTYQRGAAGEAAVDEWRKAARTKRLSDQAAARATQKVADLEKVINERLVPAQATADLLRRQATSALDKLAARLEDPALNRVPAKWQPLVTTAHKMAADIEKYPELEPILADFPQTFAQAVDYATQHGFDPTYMPDLTPQRVRDLVAGTARLGSQGTNDMGKTFTSGARRARNGTLQRLGAFDNSIDAIVAGLNQVTQEARTNQIVDWIDRVAARDLPVNAAGQRLGAPPGWVEWDETRRNMLAVDKPGNERVAVGATKMIPRVVANSIREYAGQAPTNPFYRTMKAITDPWRALMLTLNPGFYLKHFQGHVMLAAIAGGVNPRIWLDAFREARKGFVDIPQVTGLNITYAEMGTPGMVQWPSLKDAIQQGGNLEGAKYIANKMHSVVAVSDSFARAVAYLAKKDKGYTDMQAAQYAMDAVIDYGNLSNTERYWVRSIIPFYSFEKGVAKLFFKMPIDHPVAAALMMTMSKWQQEQAVDDQGNPLPERYQGVVDLPLLGKVDMQKYSPFRDVEALATPEGLVSSLQFAIQDVVRAGLGVPAPGTKASVKVDKYGRLVPDVSLGSQLGASFAGGPQGALVQSGDWKRFFGIPTVSQDTLNKAAQRNVLSTAELANSSQAQQQQAAAFPVDSLGMQMNLQKAVAGGTPQAPQGMPMDQVQALLNQKLAEQKTKAEATKAASKSTHSYKPRKGGGARRATRRRMATHRSRRGSASIHHFGRKGG